MTLYWGNKKGQKKEYLNVILRLKKIEKPNNGYIKIHEVFYATLLVRYETLLFQDLAEKVIKTLDEIHVSQSHETKTKRRTMKK